MRDHFAGTTSYTYTDAGGLNTLTDRAGGVTSYIYDTNGRLQRMNYPNGTYAEYTYNDRGWLLILNNKKSDGSIIAGFTYEYNPATCGKNGIRTAMMENILNPDGSRIQSRVDYQYDNNYRLTRETRTGDLSYDKIYTYDNTGNRLTKVENGTTTYYHYDAGNKLVNYGPGNTAPYTGNTFVTYDGTGNMTSVTNANGAVTDYTWDWMNKLVSADQGMLNIAQFQYDGNGDRCTAISLSGQTSFLYNGGRLLEEEDGQGNMKTFYTVGKGLLISRQAGDTEYYHIDGLASVEAITDAQSNVMTSYTRDAWGNALAKNGNTGQPYWYIGGLGYYSSTQDMNFNLLQLKARYYDASLGRFVSRDPIGYNGGINLYAYVGNMPVQYMDPSGLERQRTGLPGIPSDYFPDIVTDAIIGDGTRVVAFGMCALGCLTLGGYLARRPYLYL